MKIRSGNQCLLLTAICLGLAFLSGCSDNEEEDFGRQYDVRVHVLDEADRSGVPGVKLVMMSPQSNALIAGPFVTDSEGIGHFGVLKEMDARLLVFGGVDYEVFALPDYNISDFWSKSGSGPVHGPNSLMGPGEKTSPPPISSYMVLMKKTVPDSLPRIAGRVVDAESGAPLGGVFISVSPDLTGYQGKTTASDDVTDTSGEFSVSQIPFTVNPDTGNLIMINPLRISRSGYRPKLWKYEAPNGSENVDISGVTIALERLQETDTGIIHGQILRDGQPAPGVVVGLGVLNVSSADKAAVGLAGWAAVSGQDGRYSISGLPAGIYIVQPGYPLADGAFFHSQINNIWWQVGQGESVDVGSLNVLHEIEPEIPTHGIAIDGAPEALQWTAVPNAVMYQVHLDRHIFPDIPTNSFQLPDGVFLEPGLHYWFVTALDDSGAPLGATQIQAVFRIREPID